MDGLPYKLHDFGFRGSTSVEVSHIVNIILTHMFIYVCLYVWECVLVCRHWWGCTSGQFQGHRHYSWNCYCKVSWVHHTHTHTHTRFISFLLLPLPVSGSTMVLQWLVTLFLQLNTGHRHNSTCINLQAQFSSLAICVFHAMLDYLYGLLRVVVS